MSIDRKAQELVSLLKATPEFNTAKSLKNQVVQNPKLTNMVHDFFDEQSKLHSANLPPNQMETKMKQLVEAFDRKTSDTVLKDYSTAMQQVQAMIYKLNMFIVESIEKDLSIDK